MAAASADWLFVWSSCCTKMVENCDGQSWLDSTVRQLDLLVCHPRVSLSVSLMMLLGVGTTWALVWSSVSRAQEPFVVVSGAGYPRKARLLEVENHVVAMGT